MKGRTMYGFPLLSGRPVSATGGWLGVPEGPVSLPLAPTGLIELRADRI
jgi:hypothetical protein